MIDGVIVTPLKKILHDKGDIYHALKSTELSFVGFGEAYFSTVYENDVKGWKKHTRMTLNIIVPVGEIEFVLYDDRVASPTESSFQKIFLSQSNYCRLTIPPNVWVGFKGCSSGINLLLNIASIEHDEKESVSVVLDEIKYNWS